MKEHLEVERAISSFDKINGRLIETTRINLSLAQLKTIFTPHASDPLLYGVYDITGEQATQLAALDNSLVLELARADYQLECYQAGT